MSLEIRRDVLTGNSLPQRQKLNAMKINRKSKREFIKLEGKRAREGKF